jgi:hypothetical protein
MTTTQARSMDELEATLRDYESTVRDYVQERPLTAVAAAFAAGYVLGGGLTPRLSWIALSAFGRMALADMVRDMALGRAR